MSANIITAPVEGRSIASVPWDATDVSTGANYSRRLSWLSWSQGLLPDAELVKRHQAWAAGPLFLYFSRAEPLAFSRSLASKRGNDVYRLHIRRRLDRLNETIQPFVRVSRVRTNAVLVTLTLPHIGKRSAAWLTMGVLFNRFMSNLRKEDGRIEIVRSWEATKTGWPHAHVLLLFQDRDFKTQLRWKEGRRGKPGGYVSRVEGSRRWRRYWPGHIDVEGAQGVEGAVHYISKEILKYGADLKGIEGDKAALTQAICWASGRRSFSISRKLARGLSRDPKGRLDDSPRVIQTPWKFEGLLEAGRNEPRTPWVQSIQTLPEGLRKRPERLPVSQDQAPVLVTRSVCVGHWVVSWCGIEDRTVTTDWVARFEEEVVYDEWRSGVPT